MVVIDTNIAIDFLRGDTATIGWIRKQTGIFITSISAAELYTGIYHYVKMEKQMHDLREFLTLVSVLHTNDDACELFGRIKARLKSRGKPIGDFDTMIASIAISHGLPLATKNLKHFKEIEGLKIQEVS